MRLARAVLLLFAASVASAFAASPVWDSSGNSQLNGTYYFRQVLYVEGTGGISQAITFYGNIVFNGTSPGTYTTSGGTVIESSNGASTYNTTGTYSVSASGYGFMTSPLAAAFPSGTNTSLYFLVSNGILVGSDTESGFNDMIVAAPLSTSASLSSFSGTYTVASMFPGADATFQLNSNGA